MLIWTPESGPPWFDRLETETDIVERIAIISDDATVLAVTHEISPATLPEQIEIVSDTTGVTLTAPHLLGAFPIRIIRYRRHRVEGQCTDFDDLPQDAEEVFEYRKDPNSPRIYMLTVSATESPESLTGSGQEIRVYEFILRANYTPGRDRLKEAVDARRHASG